ncbi:hypothetical protein ABPG74_002845 [Tetrahymena malaccensis]
MNKNILLVLALIFTQGIALNITPNCSLLASQQACQFVDKYCQYSVKSTSCNNKCESFDQPTCESSTNSNYCISFPSQCQQVLDCTTITSSDQCQINPACQWNPPVPESCTPLQGNPLQTFCQNSQETCQSPKCKYTPQVNACSYKNSSCENNQNSCDYNYCDLCHIANPNFCSIHVNGQCVDGCRNSNIEQCQQNSQLYGECQVGCITKKNTNVCSNETSENKFCTCQQIQPARCDQVNNYCQTLQAKDCQSENKYCAYTAPVKGTCTNKVQCSVLSDQNSCVSQKNCNWGSYKCQTKDQMQCQATDSQQVCTSSSKFCKFSQSFQCTNKVEVAQYSSSILLYMTPFIMIFNMFYLV